jgi:Ring finger domain
VTPRPAPFCCRRCAEPRPANPHPRRRTLVSSPDNRLGATTAMDGLRAVGAVGARFSASERRGEGSEGSGNYADGGFIGSGVDSSHAVEAESPTTTGSMPAISALPIMPIVQTVSARDRASSQGSAGRRGGASVERNTTAAPRVWSAPSAPPTASGQRRTRGQDADRNGSDGDESTNRAAATLFSRNSTTLRSNVADRVQRDLLPVGRLLSVFLVACELLAEGAVMVWSRGQPCDRPLRLWIRFLMLLQVVTVALNCINICFGRDTFHPHRLGLGASDVDMYMGAPTEDPSILFPSTVSLAAPRGGLLQSRQGDNTRTPSHPVGYNLQNQPQTPASGLRQHALQQPQSDETRRSQASLMQSPSLWPRQAQPHRTVSHLPPDQSLGSSNSASEAQAVSASSFSIVSLPSQTMNAISPHLTSQQVTESYFPSAGSPDASRDESLATDQRPGLRSYVNTNDRSRNFSSGSIASSSSSSSLLLRTSSVFVANDYVDRYIRIVNAWYLVWYIVGSVWVSDAGTCAASAPSLYRLAVALTIVYFSLLFLPLACFCLIVCCLPLFILVYRIMLPYAERERRLARAAHPSQIAELTVAAPYIPREHVPSHGHAQDDLRVDGGNDHRIGSSHGLPTVSGRDDQNTGNASDDEDASCVICLCAYERGEMVRTLPCKHHFHAQCIDEWLQLDKSCALCKQDVDQVPNRPQGVVDDEGGV